METATRFRAGDLLIVQPSDSDDPEANARAGQRCQFQRYADAPGKLADYAVVKFSEKGRNVYMRHQDLVRAEKGAE